jgi:glutamate carboxypeptidase
VGESLKDRILPFVGEYSDEQIRFLIELCSQNSYTYNPEGTNRAADMVLERLGGIFPHHEVVEQAEVGNHHILRTRKGSAAVYLVGHTDTVFPPDHDFSECRTDGDWLIGPGTGDMKGGLAVIVYALKALKELDLLEQLNITLILGADEEIGSATSHYLYERERQHALACLVAECAGPKGEIVVSRNGKAGARLDCFGEDRHVARVFGKKSSAILEIAQKIVAMEALNGFFPGVTVNVGRVEGGLGPGTVPAHASCLIDLRWEHEKHCTELLAKAGDIAGGCSQPGAECRFTILNRRPAMPPTKQTETIFETLRQVATSIDMDLRHEHRHGTSDANFFGSAGIPTLDGLGPICLGDHTPNERVLIPSLASRTSLLTLFLAQHPRKLDST